MNPPNDIASEIVHAIRSVVGFGPVGLHEPSFDGRELDYLRECLDSTFVSSVGMFVDKFEDELAKFTGAKHAIAVVNGTSALHVALKLAGVQAGDEVLLPALTFIATANAVTYCNAMPHFVDSEPLTLGIDVDKLQEYLISSTEQRSGRCINRFTGRVISAIVPMHTFGHPVNLDGLMSIAHNYHIALVEDAAESLGSYYFGRHTGTIGLFGILSFNGNKIITTGGGGAILTNDSNLAKHAKHLTTTAKLLHRWEFRHDEIGFNYRMPNLNAALGCAQLEKLKEKLDNKRELYLRYKDAFTKVDGVNLMSEPANCKSNYWLQTLLLDAERASMRDEILIAANDAKIMSRPVWELISNLVPFQNCQAMDLDQAKQLAKRIINIPSSYQLSVGDHEQT